MKSRREEEVRCFVNLADGTRRLFPTATEIREKADGGIEIWNDRICLDSFKKGEFWGRWIDPKSPYAGRSGASDPSAQERFVRRPAPSSTCQEAPPSRKLRSI
jgi:hypothetical protein